MTIRSFFPLAANYKLKAAQIAHNGSRYADVAGSAMWALAPCVTRLLGAVWQISIVFCAGLFAFSARMRSFRFHYCPADDFNDLRDDRVSQGTELSHSVGYPISQATHVGFRLPFRCS